MSEIPWLTNGANNWLEKNLKPDFEVFEYGSGASTVYFSKKVKSVVSVEHNLEFNRKYSDNVTLLMVDLKEIQTVLNYHHDNYITTDATYKNKSFEDYVKIIESLGSQKFDLILIDGRSRASCIKHSINRIKTGGYIILDDAEREEYQKAKEVYLNHYLSESFADGSKVTTIWFIN